MTVNIVIKQDPQDLKIRILSKTNSAAVASCHDFSVISSKQKSVTILGHYIYHFILGKIYLKRKSYANIHYSIAFDQ